MAIDSINDPYVLLGRVVTMSQNPAPDGIIENGAVYIHEGIIDDVREANQPPPNGFENAVRVRTGGTIYPGMIELHNHLSYNAIPLWQVNRRYLHSGHWRGTDEYKVNVTKPAMVLANTAGNAEALVRYAECRCLLGGVTSSQGITLQANSGIRKLYEGLVRNVESPTIAGLRGAKTRIGAPDKDLDSYVDKLKASPNCYLQHLSEGVNDGVHNTALKQFTGLQRDDGSWAIFKSLCGVHSTALESEHFQVLAQHGGSIVWSPLSNYLLYGETTKVEAAKEAGIPIALGSDWAPSGTKNLLGELKVAAIESDRLGGLFTPRELCEMVTSTPAEILGWGDMLGRVEAGKLADLIVVDDTDEDVYEKLIHARETSITLVVIGGIPRVGQRRLMKKFGVEDDEAIQIGRSTRILDLTTQPGDVDLGVTLAEATERLADTLQNLPDRARDLDNAIAVGWMPGVELMASGLSTDLMPPEWQEPAIRVVLEFEEEEGEEAFLTALQAGDLENWVRPMKLDGITVPNDPQFLIRLMKSLNLPRFIKERLPALYGVQLAVPDDSALTGADEESENPLLSSMELRDFPVGISRLSDEDRKRIIDQAILLLDRYYVHLSMKRTMHAIDPVQRLRILDYELQRGGSQLSDLDFHREIISIFDSLRDLHTCYRLPQPFRGNVAWLPFLIEMCVEDGAKHFIVSKIIGEPGHVEFKKGVNVLHWNGIPIDRYFETLARQIPGGNSAARKARAMNSLTLRSLTRGQIPDEDWVTITFRSEMGEIQECRTPWLLFKPQMGLRSISPESFGLIEATSLGLDDQTDDLQLAKKDLFASTQVREDKRLFAGGMLQMARGNDVPSNLPTIFRAHHVFDDDGKQYGYIRIFTFNVNDADAFVGEFERLLGEISPSGLIIDVRGNGGGLIHAAERSLELLSPVSIEPEAAQFINTPATLRLCRRHSESRRLPGLVLEPWLGSMERSVASGAMHSLGFPITLPAECNLRGQQYQGPKVLIVDGLCYSATDMFVAGFKDHGLGTIIGLHDNTGAGGANVWPHRLLQFLSVDEPDHGEFRLLPHGADLRVAVRRTLRVGPFAGELVEDFGIKPDVLYQMTRKDVLGDNEDLIDRAIIELRKLPSYTVVVEENDQDLSIHAPGAESVLLMTAAGRPVSTIDLNESGYTSLGLPIPGAHGNEIDFIAYASGQPVARTRLSLS